MLKSKALLNRDKCLLMQPELIKAVGKSGALVLQQIHYWIANQKVEGKVFYGQKWVANSFEEWANDLKVLSVSTIKRAIKKLKNLGILSIEKLSPYKSNRTNWYTINYDKIHSLINLEPVRVNSNDTCTSGKDSCKERLKMTHPLVQNDPIIVDKITNKEILKNPYIPQNQKELEQKNLKISETSKPIAQQMVEVWNKVINPDVEASLTRERARNLIAAYKYKFQNNLQKWKEYCLQIASSDYLMGKIRNGYKIALDTALKFNFIQRIIEKHFGIKDISRCLSEPRTIIEMINNAEEALSLKDIRMQIYERVGAATYTAWFREIEMELASKHLVIKAPNLFKRDWINKYLPDLQKWLGVPIEIGLKRKASLATE